MIVLIAFLILVLVLAMDSGDSEIEMTMRHLEEIRETNEEGDHGRNV